MAFILLVDDDIYSLEATEKTLKFYGYQVETATSGKEALERIRSHDFDLVISDVRMPQMDGLELMRALQICGEEVPLILMTAFGKVEEAVWAIKKGAIDFLCKPVKKNALIEAVRTALHRQRLRSKSKVIQSESQLDQLGVGPAIQAVKRQILQVARSTVSVLIQGESGVGKERVAQLIHDLGDQAEGPFVIVNCGAIPENLMESEFFGFEKGAFSGADHAKKGLIEGSDGGTLFLDEIGDMPLAMQVKLLRVLENGEVRRLGSTQSRKVHFRVLAASHRNLRERVLQGLFREDLLFRLDVVAIAVPPLRERREDLPLLVQRLLEDDGRMVSEEVMELFYHYSWPGNVRELRNVLEHCRVFATGPQIELRDLPVHLQKNQRKELNFKEVSIPVGTSLKDVEELMIRKTLEWTDGDKNMTAKLLGVNSRTIYRKLEGKP